MSRAFDDNLLKPPPSPLAPSRDLELMNFVETDDSFIPNCQTSSTGQSFTLGEASDTSSSIQRLNLLEVDNCYLLEQNRLLKKELLHNKLNVESVKKVITQKEVCLSQLQGDRNKLEERVKKLEESLDWIKANHSRFFALFAASPESSSSLTLSNVSEGSLSDRPESQPKDPNDVKTRRRSDSINFVRGLFKLNGKAKSKSKEGEDWVNCDEGITVENVKPTLNNTPLRSIKASKYGKKQTKILSALRFSSGGAIGSLPLSSECQTTREELRSQIFFKDSSPLPAKGTLPSGISQKSVVATPPSPECPPKDDIEVELFDLEPKEFSDHGSPRYSPPPSESIAVKDAVNPAEYTFPFSDASDSSNKIINSSTDSSDLTPAALSLHALAKQAEKESILGRQLALPSSIVLTMKPENDDLSASQSLSADLESLPHQAPFISTCPPSFHAISCLFQSSRSSAFKKGFTATFESWPNDRIPFNIEIPLLGS
ncbi:hypothetical protein L0F63_000714 [Massospora cicadina]|nr:hypothetical protein L0F63_000714 [Massospora cicadina]